MIHYLYPTEDLNYSGWALALQKVDWSLLEDEKRAKEKKEGGYNIKDNDDCLPIMKEVESQSIHHNTYRIEQSLEENRFHPFLLRNYLSRNAVSKLVTVFSSHESD